MRNPRSQVRILTYRTWPIKTLSEVIIQWILINLNYRWPIKKILGPRKLNYLLSFDVSTNEKHALHNNDGGTHVNPHDLSSVNFTVRTQRLYYKIGCESGVRGTHAKRLNTTDKFKIWPMRSWVVSVK